MADEQKERVTRESVDAWFAERRAVNRRKRHTPLTADDVRARAAERTTDSRTGSARHRLLPAVVGCVLLAASGVASLTVNAAVQERSAEHATNQQRILLAESELASLPDAESLNDDGYATEISEQVAAAEEAGQAVAALQQEYAELLYTGNAEDADDSGPQHAYEAALAHQSDLAPYFAKHTYLADAGDSLGEGDIDPRFPWYVGYESDGVTIESPTTSTWSLIGVNATGAAGVFEVTWANRGGETGDLFAWAVADFDSATGTFGDITVGKTTLGDSSATDIQMARK